MEKIFKTETVYVCGGAYGRCGGGNDRNLRFGADKSE